MVTKAQQKASAKYDKQHTKGLYLKFNIGTDKDIIKHINSITNKQGYIKSLIRKDIKKTTK